MLNGEFQKEDNRRRYLLNIRKYNEKGRFKSFIKEQKLLNLNAKWNCNEKDKLGAEPFPSVGRRGAINQGSGHGWCEAWSVPDI